MRENPNGLAGLYDDFYQKHGIAPAEIPKKDSYLDRTEVEKSVLAVTRDLVGAYDLVQNDDPKNVISEDEEGVRQTQLLRNISLKDGVATLEVRKTFKDFTKAPWLNHQIGDKVERIAFNLSSDGKRIGSVILEKNGETGWIIDHRETDEAHRGEGVFKSLLEIAETFAREYGEKSGKPQTMSVDLAQPDLLVILQKMGYIPATPVDAEKVSRVIGGDEELEVDYAVTSSGAQQADRNPYIFERARFEDGKERKRPINAFRMVLVKPLKNTTKVDELIKHFVGEHRKYNTGALYELYAGRMPNIAPSDKPAVSKIDLQLDKKALIQLVSDMPAIAQNYAGAIKGDPQNLVRNGQMVDGESREIHRAVLEANPVVRFSATKSFSRVHDDAPADWISGTYPPHPAGEESESVFFELHDNDTEIGGYRLDRGMESVKRNEWALNDRMVLDEYQEQGFGAALMTAAETFVQSQADFEQSPQKLTANIGQPKVLLMFLNKGFKPSSEEDQRRIDRVLAADPDLELDYAVVKEEDGSLRSETFKDLYCFERGVSLKTEVNALRTSLEKNYEA